MNKYGIIRKFFLATLIVFSLIATAATVNADDLMYFYDLAIQQDPRFRGSEYEHKASRETLKQAFSKFLPSISAEGRYTQSTQDIISSDNTVFDVGKTEFNTENYTLTLTQPIFNYSTIVSHRQAKSVIRRSDTELELAKQELTLRVAVLYLAALEAKDNLAYAGAEEEVVGQHLEDAQVRHEAGLVPITDLYDAGARFASVQAQRIEAENVLDDALQALIEVAGESIAELNDLKEKIPLVTPDPADVELWVKTALQQNPGLNIQRYEVEIAKNEVKRRKSGHYPTLDVVGRYNRQKTDGTLFGGGSEVDTTDIFALLKIPLYEGGVVNSRTRESAHLYSSAREGLTQQTRAVERQVRAAYSGVKSAISRAESLKKSIESQELVLETKQQGFESGLFTSLAVLDAGRDLFYYKRDYAKARYDYVLNSLRLRQSVGTLTKNDLAKVNEWLN